MVYHTPVLVEEVTEGLKVRPEGIYVDATYGGGGHAKAIIGRLTSGKLVAFDADDEAGVDFGNKGNMMFINRNFIHIGQILRSLGVLKIDGVVADLGVSSRQLDSAERGFSFRFDSDLDMRFDRNEKLSAREVINTYDRNGLKKFFSGYGELRNAGKIAEVIIRARGKGKKIKTAGDLLQIVSPFAGEKRQNKFHARLFQALRMEVNNELDNLKKLLEQCAELLRPGGRLVVISYHSLEDRIVKNFMRSGGAAGILQKDIFGNCIRPFQPLTNRPVVPSDMEIRRNPRARSAKLRIAEKL